MARVVRQTPCEAEKVYQVVGKVEVRPGVWEWAIGLTDNKLIDLWEVSISDSPTPPSPVFPLL